MTKIINATALAQLVTSGEFPLTPLEADGPTPADTWPVKFQKLFEDLFGDIALIATQLSGMYSEVASIAALQALTGADRVDKKLYFVPHVGFFRYDAANTTGALTNRVIVPSDNVGRYVNALNSVIGATSGLARLNSSGQVVDAAGNVVGSGSTFDPTKYQYYDFSGGVVSSVVSGSIFQGGSNGATGAGVASIDARNGTYDGGVVLNSGTTTTGRGSIAAGPGGSTHANVILGTRRRRVGWVARIPTASDGTDTFRARFGWMDTADGVTDGLWGEYSTADGTANWRLVASAGGVTETVTSTTAVAIGTDLLVEVEVNADGSQGLLFVNGVQVASVGGTRIPKGAAQATGYVVTIRKSAGTNNRTIELYDARVISY